MDCVFAVFVFSPFSRFRVFVFSRFCAWRFRVFAFSRFRVPPAASPRPGHRFRVHSPNCSTGFRKVGFDHCFPATTISVAGWDRWIKQGTCCAWSECSSPPGWDGCAVAVVGRTSNAPCARRPLRKDDGVNWWKKNSMGFLEGKKKEQFFGKKFEDHGFCVIYGISFSWEDFEVAPLREKKDTVGMFFRQRVGPGRGYFDRKWWALLSWGALLFGGHYVPRNLQAWEVKIIYDVCFIYM